ncbi:hypothetical protein THAOC_04643 [Thalassiosira oceanica]|uniref:UBA domain-containing protein n=1 Tax=Thalassiosira oceanica TaxID=159749 RepID=K0T4T7_THAOC|nr:hypothetical protein THAOC_04643 [Thalassiosira oceanica]|eukprot:EJK73718.1 hypothetical protein THAOC_04643 [Thalassiosira oceanica]
MKVSHPAAVRTLEMAYYECRVDPYRGLRVTEEEGGGDTVAASETSPEQQAALLDTEEELVEMGYGRDRAATERSGRTLPRRHRGDYRRAVQDGRGQLCARGTIRWGGSCCSRRPPSTTTPRPD